MILYENGSTTRETSGTNITINDTSNDRKLSFKKYYGNTTQETTSGKNLFNASAIPYSTNISITDDGATITMPIVSSGGGYKSTGKKLSEVCPTLQVGDNVYVYFTCTSTNNRTLYTTDGSYWANGSNKTITQAMLDATLVLYSNNYNQGETYQNIYKNLRITKTQNASWEKFTYGPTPNPYYPQPINVVTGGNVVSVVGKNIFDKDSDGVKSGVTIETLDTGKRVILSASGNYRYVAITLGKDELLGKTITLSSKITPSASNVGSIYLYFGKEGGSSAVQVIGTRLTETGSKTYTIPSTFPSGADKINILLYANVNGTSATGDYVDYTDLQVEIGNQATEYEDFKKTDYHINLGNEELCKINDYVDIIDKSSGINLAHSDIFDSKFYLSGSGQNRTVAERTSNYVSEIIEVKPNTTYTASGDFSSLGNSNIRIGYFDSEIQVGSISTAFVNGESPFTFTTGANTKYLLVYNSNDTNNSKIINFMLNEGTSATEYEPYGKQWYIKKSIGKVVLDGSESWAKTGATQTNVYQITTITDYLRTNAITCMSNYFKGIVNTGYGGVASGECCFRYNTSDTNQRLYLGIDDYTTTTDFKNWLSTHNTTVYYVLNTPTYTIITDTELVEQLDTLYNDAVTYDNVTNIMQSNTGLPVTFDIEYLQPLDFSRNGLGYLPNVLNATVIDEINGEYSLTFEYPINDDMAKEIYEDRIVKCKVSDGTEQCFIIKQIQKNFDKMTVYCTHLFYMLYDDFIEDTYPQNLSPKPFLDHILSRANYQLPFVANSDITTTRTARYVRKNVVETILGEINNSMYNLWGMELKRDNWNIGLKARLGSDKGEKLIFGKNITGIDINIDTTGIYTQIMPIGFDGLLLPEKYVNAPNIDDYPYPRICLYEFPDIMYDPNEQNEYAYHTEEEAYQALRDAVNELYNEGINLPLINIRIDWLELSKTEEYKQYSALERVDLGDTLTCNILGMDYTTRVIRTEYNPLTDRIETFEIGTAQPSITKTVNKLDFDVINLPSSMLDEATANATRLITEAMGGYVYKTNSELYIMDNEDPNQAVHVWRWNINGLGYSSTGINGTYGLAMTMDGQIVADFITTGQLNANVLSAGTIIGVINGNTSQLKLDADQIDLTATDVLNILAGNSLNLTTKNITIDSTNFSVDNGGNMTCSNATITGGEVNLVDDGLSETVSKIKVSSRDNAVTNEIFSYGMEINNTTGTKIEISTGTTDNIYIEEKHSDNSKEKVTLNSGALWQRYEDTNGNITRWVTLYPGDNNDSAFTLGTGSSTNFEIHNEQNNSFVKVKGSLTTSDSNGNTTFSADSNGNITSPNTHCSKTIPSSNLNDIKETGIYFYNNGGADYTNSPRGDGVHYLVVTTTNTDWVVQEDYYLIWGASEIHKYIRMYTPAGWTNWQTII